MVVKKMESEEELDRFEQTAETVVKEETNIPAWQSLIVEAIKAGGRQESDFDKHLCTRLKVIEELLIHQKDAFQDVLDAILSELSKGVSSQFILRLLNEQQPLYNYAAPQEQGLLHGLSAHLNPLHEWLASNESDQDERHRWLDWFECIQSPAQAERFFSCMTQEYIKPFSDDLMRACLLQEIDEWGLRRVRAQGEELTLLAHCIREYQYLSSSMQSMLSMTMADSIANDVPLPQVDLMLSLLCQQEFDLPEEQVDLLISWWNHGSSGTASQETLTQLLEMMAMLGHFEVDDELSWDDLIADMIQGGIASNSKPEQLLRALECFNTVQSLSKPWQTLCYRYVKASDSKYFSAAWLQRFQRVAQSGITVIGDLSEEEGVLAVQVLMNCSDVDEAVKMLGALLDTSRDETVMQLIPYAKIIEVANRSDSPIAYLQAMGQLTKAFCALMPQQQSLFWFSSFDEDMSDSIGLSRETHFLKMLPELTELGIEDKDSLIVAHDLWHKKPFCTAAEFSEHMKFFIQARKCLGEENEELMQQMFAGSSAKQRLLMSAHVLPNETDPERIAALWKKIQNDKRFMDPVFLCEVIKTQKWVDELTDAEFIKLLDFNNPDHRKKRQMILRGLYHHDIDIPPYREDHWWTSYFNALAQWVQNILISPQTELDEKHHLQAVSSLGRIAYGVEELREITSPDQEKGRTPLVSSGLMETIRAYKFSYNASWWRSRDRVKLANEHLFSLCELSYVDYTNVFDAIDKVMCGIIETDQNYSNRNGKGYSRLYDIALQLLSITLSEALEQKPDYRAEYTERVKKLITNQKELIKPLDLELPAFQHLQDIIDIVENPTFRIEMG